jgi:NAD(P)-dependent dehydrogenase (short-subunit alcohol dehydrogenase family)
MSRHWTETDIPDLRGRTAVVTGASTGLGFEVARMLAGHGATVIMACRNTTKAETAADRIRGTAPGARVRTMLLDLASLASVREAAAWLRAECLHLDLLVNNAGGINPRYRRTEDGFETTLGTNHLGPFAFTGLVLNLLLAAPAARIVTVSSVGHWRGIINFDDLQFERGYRYQHAYCQSKLANPNVQLRVAAADGRGRRCCHRGRRPPWQRADRVRPGHVRLRPGGHEPAAAPADLLAAPVAAGRRAAHRARRRRPHRVRRRVLRTRRL